MSPCLASGSDARRAICGSASNAASLSVLTRSRRPLSLVQSQVSYFSHSLSLSASHTHTHTHTHTNTRAHTHTRTHAHTHTHTHTHTHLHTQTHTQTHTHTHNPLTPCTRVCQPISRSSERYHISPSFSFYSPTNHLLLLQFFSQPPHSPYNVLSITFASPLTLRVCILDTSRRGDTAHVSHEPESVWDKCKLACFDFCGLTKVRWHLQEQEAEAGSVHAEL